MCFACNILIVLNQFNHWINVTYWNQIFRARFCTEAKESITKWKIQWPKLHLCQVLVQTFFTFHICTETITKRCTYYNSKHELWINHLFFKFFSDYQGLMHLQREQLRSSPLRLSPLIHPYQMCIMWSTGTNHTYSHKEPVILWG